MTRTSQPPATLPEQLEAGLLRALEDFGNLPHSEGRELPCLSGVNRQSGYGRPAETVRNEAIDLLVESRRVFQYDQDVVIELYRGPGAGPGLGTLLRCGQVEPTAAGLLANLFLCNDAKGQYPPPKWFTHDLLYSDLLRRLPEITCYATRPLFDVDFVLRGPGWHPEAQMLIHGPEIEPIPFVPAIRQGEDNEVQPANITEPPAPSSP